MFSKIYLKLHHTSMDGFKCARLLYLHDKIMNIIKLTAILFFKLFYMPAAWKKKLDYNT